MRRVRLRADARRAQIVETAFGMIAADGLEQFRTRDVAERVGINPATLHHYFPTKEDLILGVGEHLEAAFINARETSTTPRRLTPLQALRREFADAAVVRKRRQRWLAVSRELATRAPRDAAAAAVVRRLTAGWRASIESVLDAGVADGSFRADLDARGASLVIVSALWAANAFLQLPDREFRKLCRELERSVSIR